MARLMNVVCVQHRQALMMAAKQLVYAESEAALASQMETLDTEWGATQPHFVEYVSQLVSLAAP